MYVFTCVRVYVCTCVRVFKEVIGVRVYVCTCVRVFKEVIGYMPYALYAICHIHFLPPPPPPPPRRTHTHTYTRMCMLHSICYTRERQLYIGLVKWLPFHPSML